MGYQIDPCSASPEECTELSRFLADFIRDGEGPTGDPREQTPELWLTRIRAWWKTNPFCREDTPRGLIVRTDQGEIVGFYGYIPHDYTLDGKVIRGLIATTSYVREAHRGAALPLFMKAHRYETDFHYTDGAPNKAIYPILERFGYHHRESATMHLYPVSASLTNPVRWATGVARILTSSAGPLPSDGKVITDPIEADACAFFPDHNLRRDVSLDSLSWYLQSGSSPRYFVGWCDAMGVLQCYILGFIRKKSILDALVVADYAFSDDDTKLVLDRLISQIARHPSRFELPASVSLVAWATCDDDLTTSAPVSKEFDPRLFYRLPKSNRESLRHDLPFEGDHIFQ
ncbi:MAG: hypothetical protein AAF357_12810 [Verrucomicrobiota bacterium]